MTVIERPDAWSPVAKWNCSPIEVGEGLGVVGPGRADPPPGGLFGCDGDGDGVGGEAVGGVVGDVVGELGPVGPVGGAVVVGAALLGGLNGAEGTD
ncbi:MAG: hypothetical protein KGQ66_08795, partial [Acidobacteriota bacterium]|nr:hypothetical protein [Acidobacteriota bacterium]